jgi:predicted Zn-dependent peptidase
MKPLLSAVLLALVSCGGGDQARRPDPAPVAATPPAAPAPAAEPADPEPVVEGDVTEARAGGMLVLVKRLPGAEIVASHLYIRGGARNWGRDDAGVEALLLRTAASGGTESLDKQAFSRKLADLGSSINAGVTGDFSVLRASSLKPAFDETFKLLIDVYRRPALPEAEIELQRQQLLSQLRHEQQSPDDRLDLLVHLGIFGDHPYGNRAIGSLETVPRLDAAALRAHHGKLLERSRLVLIVVGDVDPAQVVAQARGALGDLPRGAYQETAFPAWTTEKPGVFVTEQKLPTNYIVSNFVAPLWSAPDFVAGRVAMAVLARRFFLEVRSKRNLSYASSAWIEYGSTIPRGVFYVTAVDPKTTLGVMLEEARKLRREPVGDKELTGTKAVMLTDHFMRNEGTDGQAGLLAESQLLGGDWRLARTFKERVDKVTAADVQAFAEKHMDKLQTYVLGDPSKIDHDLLTAPL